MVTNEQKVRALEAKYPDLHITFAGSYNVKEATCHQVCDGAGRDGLVLESAPTREEAIDKAYRKRIIREG